MTYAKLQRPKGRALKKSGPTQPKVARWRKSAALITDDGLRSHSTQPAAPDVALPPLKIGDANDPLELDADRAADRVMAGLPPSITTSTSRAELRRKCAGCEEDYDRVGLQRKPHSSRGPMTPTAPDFAGRLQRERARGGQGIDTGIRSFMERGFGADFTGVRLHSGHQAAELTQEISARAFTIGHDVFFNRGELRPWDRTGQRLIAHELAHVVQQRGTDWTIRRQTDGGSGESATNEEMEEQPNRKDDADEVPDLLWMIGWTGDATKAEVVDLMLGLSDGQHLSWVRFLDDRLHQLQYSTTSRERERFERIKDWRGVADLRYLYITRARRPNAEIDSFIEQVREELPSQLGCYFEYAAPNALLYLEYLRHGQTIPLPSLATKSETAYFDLKEISSITKGNAPLTFSETILKARDASVDIAVWIHDAIRRDQTPKSVGQKIERIKVARDESLQEFIRKDASGSCEQGTTAASEARVCQFINIVHCMASDPRYMYSCTKTAWVDPINRLINSLRDDPCTTLLKL